MSHRQCDKCYNLTIHFLIMLVFFVNTASGALNYTVAPSDTLYGLSIRYQVPMKWIVRVNSLANENIRSGQELEIPVDGIDSLEVQPGDTLSALALEFGFSQDYLRRYNNLESDSLKIGQLIKIPPSLPAGTYRVLPGDTILGIAIRHNLTADKLRIYNNMESDVIHPGQQLIVTPPRPEAHQVTEGESLWTIARKYEISMNNLKEWNALGETVLHPGDLLVLYPGLDSSSLDFEPKVVLAAFSNQRPDDTAVVNLPHKGEYFFSFPDYRNQPSISYWESPDASVAVDYHRAKQVLDLFISDIKNTPALDTALEGWHIVIDPGHGGLDPGAIVSVADGNGNPVVITEDEYAYDISMRLYRALYRHGASVSLTILSPDHHIRDGVDPRQTFVHRKNEVYNSEIQNRGNGWRPVGTTEGLDLRKTIAGNTIRNASALEKRKGTLFISIHADNTADFPEGTAVLFDGSSDDEIKRSRELASAMAPYLGKAAFTRHQPLRVLEGNPADAAVLVEARNIHYSGNAWALRSAELREQDALRIADGILSWAEKH